MLSFGVRCIVHNAHIVLNLYIRAISSIRYARDFYEEKSIRTAFGAELASCSFCRCGLLNFPSRCWYFGYDPKLEGNLIRTSANHSLIQSDRFVTFIKTTRKNITFTAYFPYQMRTFRTILTVTINEELVGFYGGRFKI